MDWSDSWRGAFRIELRAQAIGLAYRGWPVLPGTYPAGSHWTGGKTDDNQTGPSPVHEDWAVRAGATPDEGAEWGRRTAAVLRSAGQPVPIAATPQGRWLFLTTAGQPLSRELAAHDDIVLHGAGSWIPLPPTAFEHGIVHWRVRPEVCGWELPAPHVVQDAMVRALPVDDELAAADHLVGADRAFV